MDCIILALIIVVFIKVGIAIITRDVTNPITGLMINHDKIPHG